MKNHTISSQVINTLQQSNEPWGIKDKNSCFIYGNLALKHLHNISDSFDYEGQYDDEIPWSGAGFAKEFVIHDQRVMEKEARVCSLETHMFGKNKFISSYFQEKYPLYNDENECIGTIHHAWQVKNYSLASLHQYYKKLPASIILQPPSDIFTPREWDIIFFFLQKYTRQQIGQKLNITYRTVETYMVKIYSKIGIHSSQQLEEYCLQNNFHHYVPEKFLLS
ncbi:helix-turn-helix transcriptional regulator [Photorhabdus antumapuensis]|uniref:helix-turn-helix transcriptional regulator n=1 Tax=Photorhabdus antumapuensis TaxID=2862867 RepID=UPI001CECC1B9|nr:LuxR C-terminal-related transcriptional regulator [Photorhabdus antumapuensis]MCA6221484.1 LuxR C-terminal-related transcriptional regulator [Photorhabdus antumapuensis]